MEAQNTIHTKSVNNAISAYFAVIVCGLFLFSKDNQYLNNAFVKAHVKTALLIHMLFIINYIVFVSFGFLKGAVYFGYSLSSILTSSIFIALFVVLLFGMYTAYSKKIFKISELLSIGKQEKVLDINGDLKLDEKDKFTLILAHIPFVGYIINGEYYKNKIVKNIVFINMLSTIIILLTYIFDSPNIALLFGLLYIIVAVLSVLNILINESAIIVSTKYLPKPEEKISIIKSFSIYLSNYFSKKDFVNFSSLKTQELQKRKQVERDDIKFLDGFKDCKFPNILIYIPFVNIFGLGCIDSKNKFHIINGLIITLLFSMILVCSYFYIVTGKFALLLIIPMCFGFGFINSRPAYRMPFIYEIFELLQAAKNIFYTSKANIKKRQAEVHEEKLVVKK